MKNIIITNLNINTEGFFDRNGNAIATINLNPWGFSKLQIEYQTHWRMHDAFIQREDDIFLCIKKYFFGRRVDIICNKLTELYPNNLIIKVES